MKIDPLRSPASRELEPLVVLTGAGISAESGIPTFRDSDGLWHTYRAQDLATPEAFAKDPELVWRFYRWRIAKAAQAQPNQAHELLVALEKAFEDFLLITQNVDGLHPRAGSRKLVELHGSLWRARCTQCQKRWSIQDAHEIAMLPTCSDCGSLARPDVVWFGEALEEASLTKAAQTSATAKTMLIIGTSALVYPAAEFPFLARRNGARLVEINPEQTPLSSQCDVTIRTSASAGLKLWWTTLSNS